MTRTLLIKKCYKHCNEKTIQNEIDLLKTELIQPDEMERVSAKFVSGLVYSQDDIAGQTKMIGNLEINGLSYRLIDELPQHFETVTPQDIQRVANIYFVRDNLSTLYLSPENKTQ